ncbi:MAG TPA: hypothetical protein GXX26_08180 [Clostridiaceae bacterium]|nr:hypothetical protein [Clostridiaceae bacterium]
MEKTSHFSKGRVTVYIIIAVIIIAAVAAGIYFLNNKNNREPSRGTYVIDCRGRC